MSKGHEVVFFERPRYLWEHSAPASAQVSSNLTLARTSQLANHQLRIWPLGSLNNSYEKKRIVAALAAMNLPTDFVIVNFNYDYYFLRDIFPRNRIITLINDDFIAQSGVPYKRHLVAALKATCRGSDAVLAVSSPLLNQLRDFCDAKLFMPWSEEPYVAPLPSANRNAVLFWGTVDRRLDVELLKRVASEFKGLTIHLVGPMPRQHMKVTAPILRTERLELISPRPLARLPLQRYFASIIPYRGGVKEIEAVSLSNKALRLLARGLPLVNHGMPRFLQSPAIFNALSHDMFIDSIGAARERFWDIQADARALVEANSADSRYEDFMSIRCLSRP